MGLSQSTEIPDIMKLTVIVILDSQKNQGGWKKRGDNGCAPLLSMELTVAATILTHQVLTQSQTQVHQKVRLTGIQTIVKIIF